ncbi:MAG: ATP-binding protein, partial [Planctomycetota bacterium]
PGRGDTILGLAMAKKTGTDSEAVRIRLTASYEYVRPIRNFLRALCEQAEYDEDETETLALVATELINNSIEHGSRSPRDRIELTALVREEVYRLQVRDAGGGGETFAREALEIARTQPALEAPRGRGLYLIRSSVDRMAVDFDPKRGTRVSVSKARRP